MSDEHSGCGSIQCSLCQKTFKQKKELFHHMSSATHRRQSVRCPWCRKLNVFTRVSDLSRHCDSVHFREYSLMPDGFLSIPNCFYLAVYPKDYASMTKIQKYDSAIAIEARRVLINHLDTIKAGEMMRNEIREGWKAGLEIAEEIEKKEKEIKHMKEAKRHPKRKNIKETEIPAKKMKKKITFEETKAVYDQIFKTNPIKIQSSNDTPPMSETECENADGNIKVVLTRLDENGVRRLMVRESQNGKTEKEKLIGKPFTANSRDEKQRKLSKVDKKKVEEEVSTSEAKMENKVVPEVVADEKSVLNDDEKVRDDLNVSDVTVVKDQMEQDEVGIKIEIVTEEQVKAVAEKNGKENKVSNCEETVIGEQVNLVDVVDTRKVKGGDMVKNEKKTFDETCVETEEKETVNDPIEGELELITDYLASKIKQNDIFDNEVIEHTQKKKTNNKDCMVKVKFAEPIKERVSYIGGGETIVNEKGDSVEIEKGEDDIWRKVKDINNNSKVTEEKKVDNKVGESKEYVNSCEEKGIVESNQVEPSEEVKYIETAMNILKKGAMPLCPPARRQWGPDTLEEIDIGNGQVVQWPPKGWLKMTPDKRLLTVEMMAMTLEAFVHGEVDPEMSRCYLLDKYKYLMLPGALTYRKEKGEDTITRARFQNFSFLKEVAAGKKLSFGEVQHLRALECVSVSQNLPLDPSNFTTPLQLQKGPLYLD